LPCCLPQPLGLLGASTRQLSRLLLTPFKKVRGELVTSKPPWRSRTSAKHCSFTTSGIGSRASRYEEGLAWGAFHSGANFRYPLVDAKRRSRECSAFFYARRPIHEGRSHLRVAVGSGVPSDIDRWNVESQKHEYRVCSPAVSSVGLHWLSRREGGVGHLSEGCVSFPASSVELRSGSSGSR